VYPSPSESIAANAAFHCLPCASKSVLNGVSWQLSQLNTAPLGIRPGYEEYAFTPIGITSDSTQQTIGTKHRPNPRVIEHLPAPQLMKMTSLADSNQADY
jgi:hypothetical protein